MARGLHPGTSVGGFIIHACIGQGGMGEVWLAEQISLRRPVAIKRIADAYAGDAEFIARFEREAQVVAGLTDPHVVVVHDFGVFDDEDGDPHTLLIMEYLDGGRPLSALIAQPLPWSVAAAIVAQVADGLATTAAAGVVHRDIKPENILITGEGVAKIVDFGLARGLDHDEITVTGRAFGSLRYSAPEQIAAKAGSSVDCRSDLYALGATWYHLVTGTPPFTDEGLVALARAHAEQPPPALAIVAPDHPEELSALIHRCLAKDPAQRFADPAALRAALTTACARLGAALPARIAALAVSANPGTDTTTRLRRASFGRDGSDRRDESSLRGSHREGSSAVRRRDLARRVQSVDTVTVATARAPSPARSRAETMPLLPALPEEAAGEGSALRRSRRSLGARADASPRQRSRFVLLILIALAGGLGATAMLHRQSVAEPARQDPPWADAVGSDVHGRFADIALPGGGVLRFRLLPGGALLPGAGLRAGGAATAVEVPPFWLLDREVTSGQWQALGGPASAPSDQPAGGVTWLAADAAIARLRTLRPGLPATLPSALASEWAARAPVQGGGVRALAQRLLVRASEAAGELDLEVLTAIAAGRATPAAGAGEAELLVQILYRVGADRARVCWSDAAAPVAPRVLVEARPGQRSARLANLDAAAPELIACLSDGVARAGDGFHAGPDGALLCVVAPLPGKGFAIELGYAPARVEALIAAEECARLAGSMWDAVLSAGRVRSASQATPDAFGCYDLAGNLAEWCADAADGDPRWRLSLGGSIARPATASWPGRADRDLAERSEPWRGFRIAIAHGHDGTR